MKDKDPTVRKVDNIKWTTILLVAIVVVIGAAIYFSVAPRSKKGSELEFPIEKKKTPAELVIEQVHEMLAVGQSQAAVEIMQDYIAKTPTDVTVRPQLGELYLILDQVESARKQIEDTLKISPNNPRGLWMKGMLARKEGKDPTVYFSRAAKQPKAGQNILGMYGLWLMERNDPDHAKEYLDRAVAGGSMDGKVFMGLGQIAFAEDKYENAIEFLHRAIRINPTDPGGWAMLADVQKNIGRPIQAVGSLEQALRLARGPIRGDLLMQLGMACIVCRDWPRAGEVFEQATQYSKVQKQAYIFAARSRYFAKQYDLAAKNIDKAWELSPGHPEIKQWREKIALARFGKKKETTRIKPTSLFDSLPKGTEEEPESPWE